MDANDQDDSQTAPYVTDEDEAGMSGSGHIGGGDATDAASDSPTSLNDKAPAAPGRDEIALGKGIDALRAKFFWEACGEVKS